MLKKIFKVIWTIIVLLLILIFFFAVIKPAYIDYKQNKKDVIVDTSGERATSKNKKEKENDTKNNKNNDNNKNNKNDDDEDKWKLEKKDNYDPFTFDDRILLYEGNINSDSMNKLMDVLIEDVESKTYSKVDVSIEGTDIFYSDKDNYNSSLINFKNSISSDAKYTVKFEYNTIRTVVNKVVITKN